MSTSGLVGTVASVALVSVLCMLGGALLVVAIRGRLRGVDGGDRIRTLTRRSSQSSLLNSGNAFSQTVARWTK